MAIFSTFFLGNEGQENVFYDILERKNAFLGYKNKKFKQSKNWHFSKGVNRWFWFKNCHFFQLFCFRQYRSGKCLFWYSRTKKRLSSLKKQEDQKIEKLAFFQLFFFRQYKPENVFYDILERKNPFLSYKNTKFKKSKNWNFSKGVNQWFSSENGHFSNFFFLGNIV